MSDEQLPNLQGEAAAARNVPVDPPGAQTGAPAGAQTAQPRAGVTPEAQGAGGGSLAAVMELEVPVSIELGRTRMSVEDVLALGRGSVVQLDRLVGQPVEVYVSNKPFATGEVVVLGEKFGVRILRIREPAQRTEVPS